MCHVTDFETVHDDREKETVELNKMTMKIRLNKQIISIALPVMVQNLAFYAMQFTSTAFIGHYKIEGLSAINNAMIPFHMFFSFFIALSQGTTIMIAQAIGRKDYKSQSCSRNLTVLQSDNLFRLLSFLVTGWKICAYPDGC